MKKIIVILFILLSLAVLVSSSGIAFADCVDLGRATSWYLQGAHSVIFYYGTTPMARVDVPYCVVDPSSIIRFTKNYICDSDNIIVDGESCLIMTVSSAPAGSF